jgi:hypothetical protein
LYFSFCSPGTNPATNHDAYLLFTCMRICGCRAGKDTCSLCSPLQRVYWVSEAGPPCWRMVSFSCMPAYRNGAEPELRPFACPHSWGHTLCLQSPCLAICCLFPSVRSVILNSDDLQVIFDYQSEVSSLLTLFACCNVFITYQNNLFLLFLPDFFFWW